MLRKITQARWLIDKAELQHFWVFSSASIFVCNAKNNLHPIFFVMQRIIQYYNPNVHEKNCEVGGGGGGGVEGSGGGRDREGRKEKRQHC